MNSEIQPSGHGAGLARALSKLGFCSRSQASLAIAQGRVKVNGTLRRDPLWRVRLDRDRIEVDGQPVRGSARVYLMLNKPRGLVTTASDEKGRGTVFDCLAGQQLPFVSPVGRLDRASEGLLLFTNDTAWAAAITDPAKRVEKTYHVQIDRLADETLLAQLRQGIDSEGELLGVKCVELLRSGEKQSWLKIVLDEGRNRHIRRMLETLEVEVLRLVRVAVGGLPLGNLAKGKTRRLNPQDLLALGVLPADAE
jgi:23S rRNA pseudouridine2605 synthase